MLLDALGIPSKITNIINAQLRQLTNKETDNIVYIPNNIDGYLISGIISTEKEIIECKVNLTKKGHHFGTFEVTGTTNDINQIANEIIQKSKDLINSFTLN